MGETIKRLTQKFVESFKKNRKFLLIAAGIIVLSVVIDQVSKVLFENWLTSLPDPVPVIGDWLTFDFTLNPGASFGMMKGKNGLFFALTLIGLPMFAVFMGITIKDSKLGAYGIAVIISGVIGNAIDRAFLNNQGEGFFNGGVRDFISLRGFAIFNFADICINVGVAVYILGVLFIGEHAIFKKKVEKKEETPTIESGGE